MSYKHLCMLFGITPSACSRIINTMLSKVTRKLWNQPFAQVRFPDEHKMREYADMVQLREPKVDNIIGFMDGISFSSECTDERIEQNAFYCGYDCDTAVNITSLHLVQMVKYFLLPLIFLGVGRMVG
jgi:hypothetical protein